jgi:hypothetical protein
MSTTLELPTKRESEEIGSGSGLEASKKPKADSQSQSADYWDVFSFHEFLIRYGDSSLNPWNEWEENLIKWNDKCKIREIQIYLVSHYFLSFLSINSESFS